MSKATGSTLGFGEFIDNVKVDLRHGNKDHLGNAIAYGNFKGGLTAVPEGDKYLALIVRVNESDEVSKDDPVFVAEA